MYDPSGVGRGMRKWAVVTLGTWHPYKQANTLIWHHWAARVFAPLFHDLIPQSKFHLSARLVSITAHLSYVRLAYPMFKAELTEAINFCTDKGNRIVELSHLQDLKNLCEFFIPVVSASISVILRNDVPRKQVQDYGCLLKMDNGRLILRQQIRLLHVFLMLHSNRATEYQRALSASIAIWTQLRHQRHPVWTMFASNASAFNEESGEICFSVLARGVAKSGARSDLATIDKWFRLVRTKIAVAKELGLEIAGEDFKHLYQGRCTIPRQGKEAKATAAFFSRMIRTLKAGRFVHYDKRLGQPDLGGDGIRPVVKAELLQPIDKNVEERFSIVWSKLESTLNTYWVYPHSNIWPGAVPQTVSSSDDEPVRASVQRRRQRPSEQKSPERGAGRSRKRNHRMNAHSDLIGRVIRIPATEFGDEWAIATYGADDAKHAFHHGRISNIALNGNVSGTFLFTEESFTTVVPDARKWLVPVDDEHLARDGLFF